MYYHFSIYKFTKFGRDLQGDGVVKAATPLEAADAGVALAGEDASSVTVGDFVCWNEYLFSGGVVWVCPISVEEYNRRPSFRRI